MGAYLLLMSTKPLLFYISLFDDIFTFGLYYKDGFIFGSGLTALITVLVYLQILWGTFICILAS